MPSRYGWRYNFPPNVDFDINLASPQARGLVCWLPLPGPRRGGYLDRAQRRTYTPNNGPVWTADGWFGESLLLDDVANQYLSVSGIPVAGYPLTVVGWFRSDDITTNQGIVALSNTASSDLIWIRANSGPAAIRLAVVVSGAVDGVNSTANWTDGAWNMACGVLASATDRAVFVNGRFKGTDTSSAAFPSSANLTTVGAVVDAGSVGIKLSGKVADVRIYNRALSDAEVWGLYDPATRFDLYRPRVRMWAAAPVGPPPSGNPWYVYAQQ